MASIESLATDLLVGVDFGLFWLVVEPGIKFKEAARGYAIISVCMAMVQVVVERDSGGHGCQRTIESWRWSMVA